jgi:hypothetical protein
MKVQLRVQHVITMAITLSVIVPIGVYFVSTTTTTNTTKGNKTSSNQCWFFSKCESTTN